MTTIHHTEAELHALLDSLTEGQLITGTWKHGAFLNATTGPVSINGKYVTAYYHIRNVAGRISPDLTSIEAVVEQAVTVTRDDPPALLALVESLTVGQRVTAEWRLHNGELVMIITGPVRSYKYGIATLGPLGSDEFGLSECGNLHAHLHSVTATVAKTIRWEREA